jgi:hypothetical protein
LVTHPGAYPWSSYRRNGNGLDDRLVPEHGEYTRLGFDLTTRAQAYAALVAQSAMANSWRFEVISNKAAPWGCHRFQAQGFSCANCNNTIPMPTVSRGVKIYSRQRLRSSLDRSRRRSSS